MDIFGLTLRLFRAEIRKLLLIIGTVSIVIIFQCIALPYGKVFSSLPANKSSIVSNATILNNLNTVKLFVNVVANDANGSDSEEEARYWRNTPVANMDTDLASEVDGYLGDSFHKFKDQNSYDLTSKQRKTQGKSLMTLYNTSTDNSSTQVKAAEIQHDHFGMVEETKNSEKMSNHPKATTGYGIVPFISSVVATEGLQNLDPNSGTSGSFFGANLSSLSNTKRSIETQHRNSKPLQNASALIDNYSTKAIPLLKRWDKKPISVSQMNSLLLQSTDSSRSSRPRRFSARDRELLSAKQEIEDAHVSRKTPVLYASVYWNISKFERSYEVMEQILKVYVYREGAKPIFHQPMMRGIYASEGWFMKLIEGNKKFVVKDPRRAHLFYLPISSNMLRTALYGQDFQNFQDLQKYLKDYVEFIAGKYSFWNRTGGADHFLVACHDWALKLTKHISCLRALCNANAAKDFKVGKDTTLPVTYIRSAEAPLENLGGKPPLERNTLAFFAGGMHGYLRPILLLYWQNKEPDMKIFGPMPRDIEVFVQEKDIPNLRNILLFIPDEKYLEMHSRLKLVQRHFLWHKKPVKYDLFHMILHSVWYNRVLHIKT
ncbi:probable glycosyltransferase At5g03795 isoform X2 [Durio zibethinus]|uniref:Probable glycosyltransferase At5g03795 isoform X2 n=1 Tax=Durio zibethinus TaxID=66656 RepID=A0A6P5ZRF8_DURZI|nr:probable glycosyltransferase At5g03795 isoform X2 [Durio zibethinus]